MATSQNQAETQKPEPMFCSRNCGFFAKAAFSGMCSVCFKEEQKQRAEAEEKKMEEEEEHRKKQEEEEDNKWVGRCRACKKRVGMLGFQCRCGKTFCGLHRYPEEHKCSFDYKSTGRAAIAKANPVVVAKKVDTI